MIFFLCRCARLMESLFGSGMERLLHLWPSYSSKDMSGLLRHLALMRLIPVHWRDFRPGSILTRRISFAPKTRKVRLFVEGF